MHERSAFVGFYHYGIKFINSFKILFFSTPGCQHTNQNALVNMLGTSFSLNQLAAHARCACIILNLPVRTIGLSQLLLFFSTHLILFTKL